MNEYHVEWSINILAESPKEAAQAALRCVLDRSALAHVFDVTASIGDVKQVDVERIDLDPLPSHWDDDPDYPVKDWKAEVANGDTRMGYREWTDHQKEIER